MTKSRPTQAKSTAKHQTKNYHEQQHGTGSYTPEPGTPNGEPEQRRKEEIENERENSYPLKTMEREIAATDIYMPGIFYRRDAKMGTGNRVRHIEHLTTLPPHESGNCATTQQ
jgi:hypothetical protein